MTRKEVSIIIPVKNRPNLVQDTLRSVQAQTYPHWEAVVVDDRSADGTRDAVASMAAEDDRIRLLQRPKGKGGAPACRNLGWRNAEGDYIIFLDSDDLLTPDCLQERVRYMQEHPELDFAVFGAYFFDKEPGDKAELFNVPTDENPLDRFLKLDLPWQTTGPIYRRSAVGQIGGWNEELGCGQDVDYGVRSLCQDLQYHHTERVDYYIRTDSSATQKVGTDPWSPKRLPSRRKRVEATYDLLKKTGNLTEQRRLRVAGNFLHLAECWARRRRFERARAVWNVCAELSLVRKKILRVVDAYLRFRFSPVRHYIVYYMYNNFPEEIFISGFSNGRKVSEEAKKVTEYPVDDYRNPYSKYSDIIKFGPNTYLAQSAIRRVISLFN